MKLARTTLLDQYEHRQVVKKGSIAFLNATISPIVDFRQDDKQSDYLVVFLFIKIVWERKAETIFS